MPDSVERMLTLAKRLLERTDSGGVSWQQEGPGREGFDTHLDTHLVTIRSRDNDGRQPFSLILFKRDAEGDIVDAIRQDSWSKVEKIDSDELPTVKARELLGALFRSARSQALKIDEQIDAALATLGDGS